MPQVQVKKIAGRFRLVEVGSDRIAHTEANNKPRDGGGHRSKAKAARQAGYINKAIRKMGH